jgi:nucleotide-binding universal stress UspA family protein
MFNRMLLPMDRSPLAECVLPHAVALARAFESRVTLVNVLESADRPSWRRAVDPLTWRIRRGEAESYLGDVALRLQNAGVPTEKEVLEGHPAERIIEYSRKYDVPLIILSSHGQNGLSEWSVSSIVHKIIQRAHTSTMLVRANPSALTDVTGLRYRRVLLPLDGSQRAELVLPIVATLARAYEIEILLAHVVRRPEMPRRMPPTEEDVTLANRVVGRNRAEAMQYLDELCARLPGKAQVRMLLSDHVAAPLHELANEEKIDLVLLTAHGYSALTRWPYGSVVSNFITYGTTPLLIIQDLPRDKIEPTWAEVIVGKNGR